MLVVGLVGAGMAVGVAGAGHGAPERRETPERPRTRVGRVTYVVRPGDTLWSIAEQLAPGEDPRPLVDALARANAVPPGALVPGQVLVVPGR